MPTLQKRSERNRLSWLQRSRCNAYCFDHSHKSARESSRRPGFMGNCPTISHTCQPYLPSRLVLFFFLVYLNDQGWWGETDSLIQGQMKLHLFSAGILAKAIMTHSGMLYRLYFSTFCFHEPLLFQIFALGNFYENLGLPMSTHLIPRAIFKKCAGDEVGVYYHFYNQHPCR